MLVRIEEVASQSANQFDVNVIPSKTVSKLSNFFGYILEFKSLI